jgi:hypothetical protein
MNTPIAVVDYLALTDSLAWSLGPAVAGDVDSGRAAGRGDPGAGLRYNAPPGAQLRDTARDFRNLRGLVAEYQQKKEKDERVPVHLLLGGARPTSATAQCALGRRGSLVQILSPRPSYGLGFLFSSIIRPMANCGPRRSLN